MGLEIWIETCGLGKQRGVVLGRVLRVARENPVWEEGNEELGHIKKVNSPWGSPFFFIQKKDGSLRPV